MEMLFMTPICLKVTLYDGDTSHDFILCRFSICTSLQMQNRSNVVIIFKRAFTKFSFRRNTLIFQEGIRKCHCRLYNFHKNVEIFCPTNRTQPGEKKYSSTIERNIEQVQLKCQDITSQASFSETLTKVTTAQHLFTLALHMSNCPKSSYKPIMVSAKSKTIEKAFYEDLSS